jgi:hypothetical protein
MNCPKSNNYLSFFRVILTTLKEYEMISKPTKYLATWISSACENEKELNSMDKFIEYLKSFQK